MRICSGPLLLLLDLSSLSSRAVIAYSGPLRPRAHSNVSRRNALHRSDLTTYDGEAKWLLLRKPVPLGIRRPRLLGATASCFQNAFPPPTERKPYTNWRTTYLGRPCLPEHLQARVVDLVLGVFVASLSQYKWRRKRKPRSQLKVPSSTGHVGWIVCWEASLILGFPPPTIQKSTPIVGGTTM